MKKVIIEALEARYNAEIAEAEATIKIYLENSVGIGEHPQHLDEMDKQLEIIASAQDKLDALYKFFPEFVDRGLILETKVDYVSAFFLHHSHMLGNHGTLDVQND